MKRVNNLIGKASTVFKPAGLYRYKAAKSRNGDVVVGGIYSVDFVKAYAEVNENVYIDLGGR